MIIIVHVLSPRHNSIIQFCIYFFQKLLSFAWICFACWIYRNISYLRVRSFWFDDLASLLYQKKKKKKKKK